MGPKRGRKRKHIYIYCTGLFICLIFSNGCVTSAPFHNALLSQQHIETAKNMTQKGEYKKAIDIYDRVLQLAPHQSPGDEALLHMGIIWSHPDNPQRNFTKALSCFKSLSKNFPKSELNNEKEVLVDLIHEIIRQHGTIQDLKKTVGELEKQLNAIKKIDIEIEEKKRKDYTED